MTWHLRRRVALGATVTLGVVATVGALLAAGNNGASHPVRAARASDTTSSTLSVSAAPTSRSSTASSTSTSSSTSTLFIDLTSTSIPIAPVDETTVAAEPVTSTTAFTPLPPPTFTATPHDDLPDEAWIAVGGSGLPPDEDIYIVQCPVKAKLAVRACDFLFNYSEDGGFFSDGAGNLRTQRDPVRRVLKDGTDCAVAPGCELRLSRFYVSYVVLARVHLSFAGPPGPRVAPRLRFEPTTGLYDGQQIHVTGDHLMAGGYLSIEQCVGGVCNYPGRHVFPAADGTLDVHVPVHLQFSYRNLSFDCRVDACWIGDGPDDRQHVPLSFAVPQPNGPTG